MTTLLSSLITGLGQGAVYALIAVSFVIIYRATGVLNFAQPALMILGAFATSVFATQVGLPFFAAVLLAMLVIAALAVGIERVAIRPMVGRPPFAAAIVTVGLFIILLILAFRLFNSQPRTVADPWQLSSFCLGGEAGEFGGCGGGIQVYENAVARFVIALAVIGLLGWWLARSKLGLAMRATALDQETALAQGIDVGRMFSAAWGISGAMVALAGALMAANGSVIQATDALFALVALPAIIIGGLDSLKGAVVGGLIVGVSMALTKSYQPLFAPWLGTNFDLVVPYVIMVVVLLIRPYGIFGTREVQRV
ncbi:branched-chain amino acid ABC transporter permease [Microbacterium sp. NIBRBAC000506063]|uniref:branched-chain amino acid ABC transporter permease n=1 Tax=Microbacterium sp. NIBRBAC000506063 TaxID=2734618 RepID=UPI001BB66528|nr:branched-chain amino acid ABC transporter permease [Microbacterium sp. NIBRBAC000506063]QTV79834.1 branched-chain amino acid ABC transporter permease [Microbacterium sp. NIBRBAC000506063]